MYRDREQALIQLVKEIEAGALPWGERPRYLGWNSDYPRLTDWSGVIWMGFPVPELLTAATLSGHEGPHLIPAKYAPSCFAALLDAARQEEDYRLRRAQQTFWRALHQAT